MNQTRKVSEDFVASLESYFGPWRGNGRDGGAAVKSELIRWIDERHIPKQALVEMRALLVRSRKIEPVNTVSIKDLREVLDQIVDRSRTPAIAAPADDVLPREEAAARMTALLKTVTDDRRRIEVLSETEECEG